MCGLEREQKELIIAVSTSSSSKPAVVVAGAREAREERTVTS